MTTTYLERVLDPWRELDLMGGFLNRAAGWESCEYPGVNVWVNGESAEISSRIPGVDRESIDISVAGNKVTLRGRRPLEERKEGESRRRRELWYGDFSRTIQLPFNIDADKVRASYKKGVLHISLQQLEADRPRKITIKTE